MNNWLNIVKSEKVFVLSKIQDVGKNEVEIGNKNVVI